jgi:sugar transferase (PEP-CTERM/EpsH1 system associated)
MGMIHDTRPLVVHVIHHLFIGGMENGLVNLINLLPEDRYRHAIVCVEDYSDFSKRIRNPDVAIYAMRKSQLSQSRLYWKLFRLFKELRPAIVHSRNRSGLDSLLPALMAGVRLRLHGEHGWDVDDIEGQSRKLRNLRKVHRPFVTRYVCVSKHLQRYMIDRVGVSPDRITQIYNGVDVVKFSPRVDADRRSALSRRQGAPRFVIGTVGRLQPVKNQGSLLRAVRQLVGRYPALRDGISVAIVGDGPERALLEQQVRQDGMQDIVEFLGSRNDVADVLPRFDVFVLPSLAEGISNTLLEAMACGVPVIATEVGGNVELVADGDTGMLVPARDDEALAAAIYRVIDDRAFAAQCGTAARARAQSAFSLSSMTDGYAAVYSSMLRSLRTPIPGLAY